MSVMYKRKRLYNKAKKKVQYGLTRITAYDRLCNNYLVMFLFVTSVALYKALYTRALHKCYVTIGLINAQSLLSGNCSGTLFFWLLTASGRSQAIGYGLWVGQPPAAQPTL